MQVLEYGLRVEHVLVPVRLVLLTIVDSFLAIFSVVFDNELRSQADQDHTQNFVHALLVLEVSVLLRPHEEHLLHLLADLLVPEERVLLQRPLHVLPYKTAKLLVLITAESGLGIGTLIT